MAFCPNCGTPNTEQAERCVACGYELIVPKQKAKFKGTIMMSGIKAPTASVPETDPKGPVPVPVQVPEPKAPSLPPPPRNLSGSKTMLGQPPIALPSKPEPKPPSAPPADLGTMPTMQGNAPGLSLPPAQPSTPPYAGSNMRDFQPDLAHTNPLGSPARTPSERTPSEPTASTPTPSQPTPSAQSTLAQSGPSYGGAAFSGGAPKASTMNAGRASMGGAYESTMPPAAPPNPAKVIAVGCGVVLALLLVVGGALWFAFGDRIRALVGGDSEAGAAEAAAWHASIAQSLSKVNELCATDCAQAGVFFHPLKQAALLDEARALNPARVAKLNDPTAAKAAMLDHTDDAAIATQLGLDPQQCARVTHGGASVISCSVPDPTGKPSVLRIVQLSGISSL